MAAKYVIYYEGADDFAEKAPLHGAAHRARLEECVVDAWNVRESNEVLGTP